MDKHKVTSELAFYRTKLFGKNDSEREGVAYTAGRNLVGEESLIYKQWFPETKGLQGYARAVLFVGRSPEGLPLQELTEDGWRVEETGRIVARDYGIPLAEFDYVLMRKTSGASASNFKSP
jgi:dolichol-phosphate mannosyltransferase